MKNLIYIKNIFITTVIILLTTLSKTNAQNIDKLYEKIDLFSEVLEKIFQEWIDYLIDIGRVKRESVNWKLLQEAIVEARADGFSSETGK